MIIKKILIAVLAWFLLSHNVLADNCQNQSSESGQKTNPGSIGKIDLKQKVDEIWRKSLMPIFSMWLFAINTLTREPQ